MTLRTDTSRLPGVLEPARSCFSPEPPSQSGRAKLRTKFDSSRIGRHFPFRYSPNPGSTRRSGQYSDQGDSAPRIRKPSVDVLSAPINIPPEYARLQYSSTVLYKPENTSPVDSVISQGDDCPQLSRFSWQSYHQKQTTHLHHRTRHIEIIIPDWASPQIKRSKRPRVHPTPPDLLGNLSKFPSPPCSQLSIEPSRYDRVRRLERPRDQTRKLIAALDSNSIKRKPLPSLHKPLPKDPPIAAPRTRTLRPVRAMADGVMSPATASQTAGLAAVQGAPTNNLSSLVGNVHRTTGAIPTALVGASTVVSGDKLYVFGGRRLSRRRPQLTQDLYELDLVRRHWTSLQTTGTKPAPRYFHSVCALGDTKLVVYGGMAPIARTPTSSQDLNNNADASQAAEPEIVVMSDIHIYDINNRSWTLCSTPSSPPGRYAHCATILPSWSVFTSDSASLSSARAQTPNSANPGQSVSLDGRGGAEMVVVGGQDGSSRYIEEISIFNLRNMTWTITTELGRSCGAYRSVVAPLTKMRPSQIGLGLSSSSISSTASDDEADSNSEEGYATLIYSNYNFLDVRLELQIRHPDGRMFEKQMTGIHSPPGLRFPNGEVLSNHFIVSGTFLTSTRQEYALWALNLRTLVWTRIDVGPGILTSGSWNRGILWRKRNTFVVLGDRRRNLAEDYNHRRLNFSNICTVELEAFGLYEDPVATAPAAGYDSASSPLEKPFINLPIFDRPAKSEIGQDIGRLACDIREIADMDFLAIGGERISVNFHIIARRWGPYLAKLLDGLSLPAPPQTNGTQSDNASTITPSTRNGSIISTNTITYPSRTSSIAAVPNPTASFSNTVSNALDDIAASRPSVISTSSGATGLTTSSTSTVKPTDPEFASALTTAANARPRLLYLPHTYLTLRALVHYLYTWTLPAVNTPLCTPQVLCSLLQIARPYRINGLLESVVQRLHEGFEGRSTAAVFNAAAMAAGGMQGVAFANDRRDTIDAIAAGIAGDIPADPHEQTASPAAGTLGGASAARQAQRDAGINAAGDLTDSEDRTAIRSGVASPINMASPQPGQGQATHLNDPSDNDTASVGSSASEDSSATSFSSTERSGDERAPRAEPKIWDGSLSSVVGLQKRGLRGLMEGRALRERMHGSRPAAGSVGIDDAPTQMQQPQQQPQQQQPQQTQTLYLSQAQLHGQMQDQMHGQTQTQGRPLPSNIPSDVTIMPGPAPSRQPATTFTNGSAGVSNIPELRRPSTSATATLSPPGTALSGASSGVGTGAIDGVANPGPGVPGSGPTSEGGSFRGAGSPDVPPPPSQGLGLGLGMGSPSS